MADAVGRHEARIERWVAEPLGAELTASLRRLARERDVAHVAVMPDVHAAPEVQNGVAIATRGRLYPQAVGGDIGCGMATLAFDAEAEIIDDDGRCARLFEGLYRRVPAARHRRGDAVGELPPGLDAEQLSAPSLRRLAQRDGRLQLGTLGSGNHFLELQRAEDDGRLWLMLHSGSRGIGPAIRAHHLARGEADQMALAPSAGAVRHGALVGLDGDRAAGRDYLADHDWAQRYAAESRRRMAAATAELLTEIVGIEADWSSFRDSSHNHVRREVHRGEPLWVHRKGAQAAPAGAPLILPGSMGTASYHLEGRGHAPALASSAHGAGRQLSRGAARRQISTRDLARQLGGVRVDGRRLSALRDEAPAAYKDVERVLRAQRELTRVRRRLTPLLCYKGV